MSGDKKIRCFFQKIILKLLQSVKMEAHFYLRHNSGGKQWFATLFRLERKKDNEIYRKVDIGKLRKKYDYLIGWGIGQTEFVHRYNPSLYHLDFMIDGLGAGVGSVICGMEVSPKTILEKLSKDSKICFIIYPNLENDIIEQIKLYVDDFDFIVSRLVKCENSRLRQTYSDGNEDIIFLDAIKKLNIKNPFYVDIGVCHPVIRNNTYLLYENGFYDGVLVEPNLEMCKLAEIYRPKNRIVKAGASGEEDKILKYYIHPCSSYCGHNTFDFDVAKKQGFENSYVDIPVININRIFQEYCDRCPDIVDIDTEGMDYHLIKALDTQKFRVKIICLEKWGGGIQLNSVMHKKGYVHYASTFENEIYIASEVLQALKG